MMKVWLSLVALTACCAQTPPALKSVIGEVTAVNSQSQQISLKGDDGATYSVALAGNTSFVRIPPGETDIKKATKIAFSDVTVGDRALARGSLDDANKTVAARTIVIMTKGDLAQKHAQDAEAWQKRGVVGVVASVDPAAKTVTITTRGRDAKTIVIDASSATFRRYAAASVKFADAKASTFADVQPGDTVRALGDKNEDGTRLKAEEVVAGSFETIAGTVDSVDASAGEVHITNLQTKKPEVVRVNEGTLLRRLDPAVAATLARRLRPDAAGAGGGAGAPDGQPPAGRGDAAPPPGTVAGAGGFRSGTGGPGGPGGGRRGAGGDLQQLLEGMPALALSDLKKGDAVIVSSSKNPGESTVTAFAFIAGVEPFLAAAPRTGGQVNLGSWNLDMSGPEQ